MERLWWEGLVEKLWVERWEDASEQRQLVTVLWTAGKSLPASASSPGNRQITVNAGAAWQLTNDVGEYRIVLVGWGKLMVS